MRFPNRMTLSFFVLVVATLFSVQFIQAQDTKQPKEPDDENPSLQETFDWLKSKLDGYEGKFKVTITIDTKYPFSYYQKYKYANLRLEGCTFMYELALASENITAPTAETTHRNYKIKTPLSGIDPVSIKVSEVTRVNDSDYDEIITPETWYVEVKIRDSKFKYLNEKNFGFFISNREVAKRVSKAFQNAVKKCGGTVEPY